jgi:hypothetical protein
MLDRADAILKLAAAFAVLCLGLGVGYYYGIALPAQASAAAARIDSDRLAKQEQAREEREAKKAALSEVKQAYEDCLSDAFTNYNTRWNKSCRGLHDADLAAKKNCNSEVLGDSYCDSIKVRPANDCQLPSATADSYDEDHQQAKQMCLDQMKAAQI